MEQKQNQNLEKKDMKQLEKKGKTSWIAIGLLSCLVLVLIVVIAGYLFYRWARRGVVEDLTNQINTNVQVPVNESATLPADAIYKNSRYGFSLIYPVGWWHDQSENGDGVSMSPDVSGSGEFNDSEGIVGVMAYGWKNSSNQTLDQFLSDDEAANNQIYADYKIDKKSNVKLGGLDATRLDESYTVTKNFDKPILMKRISIFYLDDNGGLAIEATCSEDKWVKNSANLERIINSYKLDKTIYDKEVGSSVSGSDTNQIMILARNFVEANAVYGMTFDLNLDKQTDEWARLTAIPTGEQKADEAIVLMKKENGEWVVKDFGTDLSQWYDQTPGGFWD